MNAWRKHDSDKHDSGRHVSDTHDGADDDGEGMTLETNPPATPSRPISFGPFGLVSLELRKLSGFRSVRLGFWVAFAMPFFLSFAPDGELAKIIGTNLILVSGWQVPGLALYIAMQFVLPLLVAVTCAEIMGGEVAWGTLATAVLRPISRFRIILAKMIVALLYPFGLLLAMLVGGTIAGLRFGLGGFVGGTGLGVGAFNGTGELGPLPAFLELLRGYGVAGLTLAPLAALALLFGVLYLSTAAAALATVASILLMRLLVVFPPITPYLLTSHLDAYAPGRNAITSIVLLTLYTIALSVVTLFAFDRKDL